MRRATVLVVLAGVSFTGGAKLSEPAFNGATDERAAVQTDEHGANRPPWHDLPGAHTRPAVAASDNMRWMRAFSGECTSCLKECLGIRAQKLQANVAKFQAPISLITWYLFQNRPFKMWPIENLFQGLANASCAAQFPHSLCTAPAQLPRSSCIAPAQLPHSSRTAPAQLPPPHGSP